MTNCLTGASCQAKAPPEAVSSKEMVVVDERPEHDGGNARDIIPSNQIAAREARGFRELDRIPIDRSQLPDDGVMTGH
jgi:hypothetical protein